MNYLYIKGGSAIKVVEKFSDFDGVIPRTGPYQFFLAIKKITQQGRLSVISINENDSYLKINNLEAIEYGVRNQNANFVKKLYNYFRFGIIFTKYILNYKPKIIFYNLDGIFAVYVIAAAKLSGAKLVYLSHNANNIASVSKLNRTLNKILARKADKVIVHGPFLHSQAKSLGVVDEKIREYDTWPIYSKNKKHIKSSENQKKIILFLGRLEVNKGVWDLINAYLQLEEHQINNTELWFIGAGSLRTSVVHDIKLMGHGEKIKFLGPIPHDQIEEYITKANFLVTPTQSSFPEGRCMSAMESLALGKPVIAPDFGPFPFLIKDNYNGLLFETNSIESLKNKIHLLLEDKKLYSTLSINAKDFASREYDQQISFYEVIQDVFNELT